MNPSLFLTHWRRLSLVALALLALIAGAALLLEQTFEEQALSPIRTGEMQRALRRVENFQRSLGVPIDDVLALARTRSARAAVEDYSPASLDRLAEVFAVVAESGITYEKVRLLDANGKERLRINRKGGHALRVAEHELQDKAKRYFFSQARDLPDGKVFVSRIDLDVDNEQIQIPYLPTLRVSTPLRDADGKLGGVLVLNIAVDKLTSIFSASLSGMNPAWLVDHGGFWLKGPRPELEWGFQLSRPDARLAMMEPLAAEAALKGGVVQITTAAGLWTLAQLEQPRRDAIADLRPEYEQFRGGTLVSLTPAAQLATAVRGIRWLTLIAAVCVGVILVALTSIMLMAFESRKQQARDADNARQKLRLALLGGSLSMWIADLGSENIYINASWQRITGYAHGPATMDAWLALIHADDRQKLADAFRLMRDGQRASIELVLRLRHQDGRWLTLGLYGGLVAHDNEAVPSQAAGVLRDLSLIEQSQQRLELALHGGDMSWWDWNLPGGVVGLDARWGQLTDSVGNAGNTAELTLPMTSVFEEVVHLEDRAGLSAAIAALQDGRRSYIAAEYRLRQRNGKWIWVLARGEVMERSEEGAPTRVLGTFKDITQRKELEIELTEERKLLEQRVTERTQNLDLARQEAERANTAKNTFLANISHEMRTPMHGIIGFSEMGQRLDGAAPPEIVSSYFSAINQSALRLLVLLNDLLDMSKLESGMMSFHPERIDPVALIESNMSELAPLASHKNLRFELAHRGPLPLLFADPVRVGQVIRNLLANSIRYSPDGVAIRIELSVASGTLLDLPEEDDVIRIVVSDRGCGIPPAELESIFEKFVQSTRTRSGAGGSGLGLSICRDIVTHHGGRIRALNNADGGASFEVLLPVGADDVSTQALSRSMSGL